MKLRASSLRAIVLSRLRVGNSWKERNALPPIPEISGMFRQSRPPAWTPMSAGSSFPGAISAETEIGPSDFFFGGAATPYGTGGRPFLRG